MFKLFKRSTPAVGKSTATPSDWSRAAQHESSPTVASKDFSNTVPVSEVLEGNESTDWALWEDSMAVLDSQMQSLTPSARIYSREKEVPSAYQDLDPFAGVGKKSK